MKLTRFLLTTALALLILIGAVSCSLLPTPHSEALETKIYTYLEEKYPDLEFEIRSYTQDTYTSGKYIFHVFCKTNEIDFQIYQSSFLTTDSYAVTYANLAMEKTILDFFRESPAATRIKSIQWLDPYADDSEGYRFRDVDLSRLPIDASAIESIYRIELLADGTDSVAESLQAAKEKLKDSPCDHLSFEWVQNDYAIVLHTDMLTLNQASDEELLAFLTYLGDAKQSNEIVTVSYISRVKYATLRLDEVEDGKIIPGFENRISENKTAKTSEP